MPIRESFLVLIKTSRPVFWAAAPLVFLIGMKYSGGTLSVLPIIQMILLSFPFCIIGYGINDIYDYKSDKTNPRKGLIEGMRLSPKYHRFIKQASLIVAVSLFSASLLTLNATNIIAMLLLLFFSYYYSALPLRFKTKPPLDSLTNGMGYFFLPFLLGFSFGGAISEIPLKIYFVTLCVTAAHSFTTLMDYSVDKKAGDVTFAIFFGKRTAAFFAFAAFATTYFLSGIETLSIKYYLVFSSFLFLIASIYPSERLAALLVKIELIGFLIVAAVYI